MLSLQGRDDPPGSLLTATRDTEQLLLQKYRSQVIRKYPVSDDMDEDVDGTVAPVINAFSSVSSSSSSSTTEGPSSSSQNTYTSTQTVWSSSTTEKPSEDLGVDDYVGGEKDDNEKDGVVARALVHEGKVGGSGGKDGKGGGFDQVSLV